MAPARPLFAALILSLCVACGGSTLDDDVAGLKTSLESEDYAQVVADAPAVLERAKTESAGDATLWKIERYHIEALAGSGDGKAAVQAAATAGKSYAGKIDARFYVKLGDLARKAPEGMVAAVEVLDAGVKAFPERRDDFNNLIEAIKASGDEKANAALEALGYL